MGISLNELDQHKDAIQYYDTTLVIDSNDVTALMNKAISLSHLGNYQDAIDYYDLAQRVDSSLREIPPAKYKII
jgi:Tetratricopeptide repeat.